MDTPHTSSRSSTLARVAGALALACVAWCSPAGAWADEDPSGRVGRVAEVSGDVRTVSPEGPWLDLPRNQPMSTGDRVITGADGRATLEIGSSTVRVGPSTDLSILRLDDQKIFLRFEHGQAAVRVRSADILGELTVTTDEGVWVPHHPGEYRFDRAPNGVLAAQSWTGDMLLEAPDSSLPLAAGQRAEVWREGAQQTTHYRLVPAPADAFSAWVLAQEGLADRDAAANAAGAANVPAEMSGGAGLGRYGRWSNVPGVGPVWTPNGLPAGWAPYQAGSWLWIAPWGWTWVDDSAWGFAPFHYGRWLQVRGHWAWTPGRWAGRPVYAPALVGWLGGAGLLVGGAPAVGWVPLAPGEAFFPGYATSPRYWSAVNDGRPAPPLRAGIDPAKNRPRFVPVGPVAYANRGVPGAVAVVAQSALLPRVPVATMPAIARSERKHALVDAADKLAELPPPAPPSGHSVLPGSANVVQVPASSLPPVPAQAPAPATMPGKAAAASNPGASSTGLGVAKPMVATPVAPTKPDVRGRKVAEPAPVASQALVDRRPAIAPPVATLAPIAPPVPTSIRPAPFAAPAPIAPRPVGAVPPVVAPVAPVAPVTPVRGATNAAANPSRGE